MPTKASGQSILLTKQAGSFQQRQERNDNNKQYQPEDFDTKRNESDTDTNTISMSSSESSGEFNWSEEESPKDENKGEVRAKRGRRLWLAFMKLARPVRVLLVGLLGVAICITPLVVVNIRFRGNAAKVQVHIWSLWLAIIWSAACATYILVDFIPRLVIAVTSLYGGKTERLKIEIDVG